MQVSSEYQDPSIASDGNRSELDSNSSPAQQKTPVELSGKTILITGAAGFIGWNLAERLLHSYPDITIVGLDNLNDYYDVKLKEARLERLTKYPNLIFEKGDLSDKKLIGRLFEKHHFDVVVNLGAQAGVRYSITNPDAYVSSNLIGFYNILEACRYYPVEHLVYASSSSVYGSNKKVPYSTEDKVDNPVSLYAATKKSNELMAHAYSKLYDIPSTGLRFFTVYGPWGRPDMAPMLFARAISNGEQIKVFNNGNMIRDFTYIDDIVEGTIRTLDHVPVTQKSSNGVAYKIYNIGCSHPVKLMDFIHEIESAMGHEAEKIFLPMQPGDVYQTNADTSMLKREIGYEPMVTLHDGVAKFIQWYKSEKNPLK